MRLWHKHLISVLPKQQLVAQWRELSAIVGSINKHGNPKHGLVNKIMEYPKEHLFKYTLLIENEMIRRGYNPSEKVYNKITDYTGKNTFSGPTFKEWHNERYLDQCFYNLQEKFDCGLISEKEWLKVERYYDWLKENY